MSNGHRHLTDQELDELIEQARAKYPEKVEAFEADEKAAYRRAAERWFNYTEISEDNTDA